MGPWRKFVCLFTIFNIPLLGFVWHRCLSGVHCQTFEVLVDRRSPGENIFLLLEYCPTKSLRANCSSETSGAILWKQRSQTQNPFKTPPPTTVCRTSPYSSQPILTLSENGVYKVKEEPILSTRVVLFRLFP